MNRKVREILVMLVTLSLLTIPGIGQADRGSMPWGFEDNLMPEIYEPAQNAVVAWNGREEVLVLTTNLSASRPTKVLEVLPLPSEPVVTKGDATLFAKFNNLILSELRSNWYSGKGPGGSREGADTAAEVTFHEKIGAHDISVVHVLDSGFFAEWIAGFLKKNGAGPQKISPVLLATIEQYLLDGHHWFVFDVVELGRQTKTNEAVQYRFTTDKFYYPLRISNTDTGNTNIQLFAVTEIGLSQFFALPPEKIRQRHLPLRFAKTRILELNEEMAEMFSGPEIHVQTLRIQGNLKEFDLDVLAR